MDESILTPVQFYDSLSEIYDAELERRAPWVRSVDALIIRWCKERGVRNIVDFGCGNGRRVLRLLQATGLAGAAIDVSPGMVAEARRLGVDGHVMDIASDRFDASELGGRRFDLVICTWNVLGHIEGHAARRRTLQNMRALLAPGGAIVLDVNNRYNAAHYGWRAVLRNRVRDLFKPDGSGDFIANRQSPDGRTMHTFVHVFSPAELRELCGEAGLVPVEEHFVDYTTGAAAGPWSGQMCFLITERG
jgi:SAM-dependent methyltransferase